MTKPIQRESHFPRYCYVDLHTLIEVREDCRMPGERPMDIADIQRVILSLVKLGYATLDPEKP